MKLKALLLLAFIRRWELYGTQGDAQRTDWDGWVGCAEGACGSGCGSVLC